MHTLIIYINLFAKVYRSGSGNYVDPRQTTYATIGIPEPPIMQLFGPRSD